MSRLEFVFGEPAEGNNFEAAAKSFVDAPRFQVGWLGEGKVAGVDIIGGALDDGLADHAHGVAPLVGRFPHRADAEGVRAHGDEGGEGSEQVGLVERSGRPRTPVDLKSWLIPDIVIAACRAPCNPSSESSTRRFTNSATDWNGPRSLTCSKMAVARRVMSS